MQKFRSIFPNIPATFTTRQPVEVAALQLGAEIETNPLLMLVKPGVYGFVSANRVKLSYSFPFFGNSFKPYFYGHFQNGADGVKLVGRYTFCSFSRVILSVWFGGATLLTALMLVAGLVQLMQLGISRFAENGFWLAPAGGMALLIFGFLLVKAGWWLSRGDIVRISKVIEETLGNASH